MTDTIVVLRPGFSREDFLSKLDAEGLSYRAYAYQPRTIKVHDALPADIVPIDVDGAIESAERGDSKLYGAATQQVDVDASLEGGFYGLLRIVTRDAPWDTSHTPPTFSGTYECDRTGIGVDFYIMDTGIITTHDEFAGRATIVSEPVSSGGLGDDNGHGSSCASLGAGTTIGPAKDALIFSTKVLNSSNSGDLTGFTDGADDILAHYSARSALNRPAVCNISVVSSLSGFNTAIQGLITAGIVVVAAAGNDGLDLGTTTVYPAEGADVLTVGASNMGDRPFYRWFGATNWGTEIDIVSPGERCWSANIPNDDSYQIRNGTSMACGVTAGVVACMLQGYGRLTSRTEVQAVISYVMGQATTGRLTLTEHGITLPDRLIYLDPSGTPARITGVTQLARPKDCATAGRIREVNLVQPRGMVSASVIQSAQVTYPRAVGVAGQGSVVVTT